MELSSGIGNIINNCIIINEWIENGEFSQADRIIVVGTKQQAIVVNLLFKGSGKKIYYCSKSDKKYTYNSRTKWIVFNRSLKKELSQNDYNILIVPKV